MAEYIFEIGEALYNEETEEAVFMPKVVGKIIRCRDCENLMKSDDNFGEDEPYYYCDIFNHMVNFDDFCSRAERGET